MLRRLAPLLLLALAPLALASTPFEDGGTTCPEWLGLPEPPCTLTASHSGTVARDACVVGMDGMPVCEFTVSLSASGSGGIAGWTGERALVSTLYQSASPVAAFDGPDPGRLLAATVCSASDPAETVTCSGQATILVEFPQSSPLLPQHVAPCRSVHVETVFGPVDTPLPWPTAHGWALSSFTVCAHLG